MLAVKITQRSMWVNDKELRITQGSLLVFVAKSEENNENRVDGFAQSIRRIWKSTIINSEIKAVRFIDYLNDFKNTSFFFVRFDWQVNRSKIDNRSHKICRIQSSKSHKDWREYSVFGWEWSVCVGGLLWIFNLTMKSTCLLRHWTWQPLSEDFIQNVTYPTGTAWSGEGAHYC